MWLDSLQAIQNEQIVKKKNWYFLILEFQCGSVLRKAKA